jgi:hypothetical protein
MESTLEIETTICPQCDAVLDIGDRFCRRCGAPLAAPASGSDTRDASPSAGGWLEHPLVVLAAIVLTLGPFGLPLLWRSRRFSQPWKILLTGIILSVVTLVVLTLWYVFHVALGPLRELGNVGR